MYLEKVMKKIFNLIIILSICSVNCQNLTEASFIPSPGKYIVSGWVKETGGLQKITYSKSNISVIAEGIPRPPEVFIPSGAIIDGWQRILGIITIPPPNNDLNIIATALQVVLKCTNDEGSCYFDDIRFFPYNGNMKSFVYDEETQRLMAELDENNYATFYEYDIEGGLVRVKKETEKGVYTIQETRSNSVKEN
jgi:hypothetical protein